MKIIGVVLIIAGVAALIYGGFSFTTKKKAVDLGSIQIDKTEHHNVPLPPLLGVVAIIGGGACSTLERRKANDRRLVRLSPSQVPCQCHACLGPAQIGPFGSIHADLLPFIDERRNLHDQSSLQLGWLRD